MTAIRARRASAARQLAAVLAAAPLLLGACGGGDEPRTEPQRQETNDGPAGPDAGSSESAAPVDPADAARDPEAPLAVGEFCAPYIDMRNELHGSVDYSKDEDEIAAAMAPIMADWAAAVPDLRRPPGMRAELWDGLLLLAQRIRQLPAEPSYADFKAVEDDLPRTQRRQIEEGYRWFSANCDLDSVEE